MVMPHRPRFTVRRLMILVALIACIAGVETVRRRWVEYRKQAELARQGAAIIRSGAWGYRLVIDAFGKRHQVIDSPDALLWEDHYNRLVLKYEDASTRPWSSVPPDPPPPTDWVPTPAAR